MQLEDMHFRLRFVMQIYWHCLAGMTAGEDAVQYMYTCDLPVSIKICPAYYTCHP